MAPARRALDASALAAWRISATHLDRRMAPSRIADAASGGLQDTWPRAALLSLHARLDGTQPAAWEDPRLVQLWFRFADYVVPRADIGVFTLGMLPRDGEARASLQRAADAVVRALDGRALSYRELAEAMPEHSIHNTLRRLSATGKVLIRWDASTVQVLPAVPAEMDEEEARRELLRRFLGWLGPATPAQFARWAGVARHDAASTWHSVAAELLEVEGPAGVGGLLASTEEAMVAPGEASGARLLPTGDPFLYPHAGLPVPVVPAEVVAALRDRGVPSRTVNALVGRVLLDGVLVGSWARRQHHVTVAPWRRLSEAERDAVAGEAASMRGPLGAEVSLRWLD
jgi:hypothetical protein